MVLVRIKRWIMALVILYSFGYTEAFAYGFDRNAQSASWGYQPVYHSGSSAPTYQFRTTSAYINTIGESRSAGFAATNSGPRRSGSSLWDDDYDFPGVGDDDYPIGTLPEQPVGDTPWVIMLLLAAGYIAFRSRKRSIKDRPAA